MTTIKLYSPPLNDDFPYFMCPKCGYGFNEREFDKCYRCKAVIEWIDYTPPTFKEINDRRGL